MRAIFFLFPLCFCLLLSAENSPTPQATAPKKKKTDIYEKESNLISVSGIVKMVREADGGFEIMLDSKPGIFFIREKTQGADLMSESREEKLPVSLQIQEETREIVSVRMSPKGKGSSQNPRGK